MATAISRNIQTDFQYNHTVARNHQVSRADISVRKPSMVDKYVLNPEISRNRPNISVRPDISYDFHVRPDLVRPVNPAPIRPEFDYRPNFPIAPIHPSYPTPVYPAYPNSPTAPPSAGNGALSANLKAAGIVVGAAAAGGTAGYFISKAVSSSGIPGLIIGAVAGAALPVVGYGLIK